MMSTIEIARVVETAGLLILILAIGFETLFVWPKPPIPVLVPVRSNRRTQR
jgi:hypothetical protein